MLSYEERATIAKHPLTQKILKTMVSKKSNLALSIDLTKAEDILALADKVGPNICILKTHVDIIEDFSQEFIKALTALSQKHQFVIFEDRKFADIGHTVMLQYGLGIYRIADWADITNAHTIAGPGTIKGLREVGLSKGNGLLLLAELSSEGSLAKASYTEETVQMALENKDFVIGFIAQRKLVEDPELLTMTPGVQVSDKKDNFGQNYNTPHHAIVKNRTDIIIVGRGIYASTDPVKEAVRYQTYGWEAYELLLKSKT